jgi:hypothetical protein
VELVHDVAAPDELAADEDLRDRRPVAIMLDAFAHRRVGEHIGGLEGIAVGLQDLDGMGGEAAHRRLRRALHEEHDFVVFYLFVDFLVSVVHKAS